MNNQQKISYINADKLFPHPHNPRKDIGDITELAESIKAAGILQNLTVVPYEDEENNIVADKYIVIIGHRRLAGAKLAGLDEIPCVISEMDDKQQISTMLLENMQRSDLTTYEQAEGFQMMLDMGIALADISQKTGLSESTVRRRVKLLELDREKFKESEGRGATLKDYLELDKITDPELKNKVLDSIGTSNFNFTLQNAIGTEKTKKQKQEAIEILDTFATEVTDTEDLQYVNTYYSFSEITVPKDADIREYFYKNLGYGVSLYCKPEEKAKNHQPTEEELAKQHKENMRTEKISKLSELAETAFNLRKDFIKSCSTTTIRKHINTVTECLAESLINDDSCDFCIDTDLLSELLEIEIDNDDSFSFEQVKASENYCKPHEKLLLSVTYCHFGDREKNRYYNSYWGEYDENYSLDRLYSLLVALGYEMSDDEKALQDGSHELFIKDESEDE